MEIEYIGNATQVLHHKGTRVLCDPWLTDGIWGGSTYHYPPVKATPSDLAARTDYIFISHIHEAHFDPATLKHFSRETPILCLERDPNYVADAARSLGFSRIIEAPAWEMVDIDGKFQFASCGTAGNRLLASLIDSTGIFFFDDELVVHCNDNYPFAPFRSELLSRFKTPDLLLMPPGGGSAYPGMYTNMTHEEKLAKRESVLGRQLDDFCEALEAIRPRYTMPMGGDFLIGGQYWWTNEYTCKPGSHREVVDKCLDRGHDHTKFVVLQEGMRFDVTAGEVSGEYRTPATGQREEFLSKVKHAPYRPFLTSAVPIKDQTLRDLFSAARTRTWEKQRELGQEFDYNLYIDYGAPKALHLDFSSPKASESGEDSFTKPYMRISLDREDLMALLTGLIDWNTADGSYRLTFHRDPEIYEERAYGLLNFLYV